MASKLRPLYDKLYMGIDVQLLAINANRDAKNRASKMNLPNTFNEEYNNVVVPYWKKYNIKPNKNWFKIYSLSEKNLNPRYIPLDIWYKYIIPHYNKILFAVALQDKNLNEIFIRNIKCPNIVVKNIFGTYYDESFNLISKEEAINRCKQSGRCIIKQSVGSGEGDGIIFFDGDKMPDNEISELFDKYKKDFIIEEKLVQHEAISRLYSNSINTMRIITFLYENEVHILASILRIGGGGTEIDNFQKGGYVCKINENGHLNDYAMTKAGEFVKSHNDTGVGFGSVVIPRYREIIEDVKEAASKIGHFRILGWDIAVDKNAEPVCIEYNVIPGPESVQKVCGPMFGDLSDKVFYEVFNK